MEAAHGWRGSSPKARKSAGNGAIEVQARVRAGVREAELPRVEHLPGGRAGTAVERIAQDGITQVPQVNADLVGAARQQVAFDQGRRAPGKVSSRRTRYSVADARPRGGCTTVIFLRSTGCRPMGSRMVPLRSPGHAAHQGEVMFLGGAVGELGAEAAVGEVVFGDDQAAAGVLVEPVNDAGPLLAADARERRAMRQQGVDKGVLGVARARVGDEAGGFVEHEQIVVLEQDGKVHLLGREFDGHGGGFFPGDQVRGAQGRPGFGGRKAVEQDVSVADEGLHARPGKVGQGTLGEEAVQPGAGAGRRHGEFQHGREEARPAGIGGGRGKDSATPAGRKA